MDLGPDKNGEMKAIGKLLPIIGEPGKPKVDAIVFQRHDSGGMFSLAMAIKEHYKIPVLQETDDYVLAVPGSNPGSFSYHEDRMENMGNPDKPTNIARISLGTFDGYITTTKFLQDYLSNYSPTYLCPNSLDFSDRKPKKRKGHKGIRIMFSSSSGHYDGMKMIKAPLEEVMRRHKDVTFYHYKGLPAFEGEVFKGRTKKMKWVHPNKYWEYINSLEPDICLAPLTDVLFNRAKSNLRLLEYWSGKNAVIASSVQPYKETIKHGVNGMLASESDQWMNMMEDLIKHPEKRKKLGEEGYKTAKKDFNLEKNARNWVNAIQQAVDSYTPNRQAPSEYLPPSYRS